MIKRDKRHEIVLLAEDFPALAILGPRQVGKTTLAHAVGEHQTSLYLDLESPRDRSKLTDPEHYLQQHQNKLIILDEIHQMPELFQILRGLIDQYRRQGQTRCRFLVLGSASMELLQQTGETLAGRIAYVELYPFNLREVGTNQCRLYGYAVLFRTASSAEASVTARPGVVTSSVLI